MYGAPPPRDRRLVWDAGCERLFDSVLGLLEALSECKLFTCFRWGAIPNDGGGAGGAFGKWTNYFDHRSRRDSEGERIRLLGSSEGLSLYEACKPAVVSSQDGTTTTMKNSIRGGADEFIVFSELCELLEEVAWDVECLMEHTRDVSVTDGRIRGQKAVVGFQSGHRLSVTARCLDLWRKLGRRYAELGLAVPYVWRSDFAGGLLKTPECGEKGVVAESGSGGQEEEKNVVGEGDDDGELQEDGSVTATDKRGNGDEQDAARPGAITGKSSISKDVSADDAGGGSEYDSEREEDEHDVDSDEEHDEKKHDYSALRNLLGAYEDWVSLWAEFRDFDVSGPVDVDEALKICFGWDADAEINNKDHDDPPTPSPPEVDLLSAVLAPFTADFSYYEYFSIYKDVSAAHSRDERRSTKCAIFPAASAPKYHSLLKQIRDALTQHLKQAKTGFLPDSDTWKSLLEDAFLRPKHVCSNSNFIQHLNAPHIGVFFKLVHFVSIPARQRGAGADRGALWSDSAERLLYSLFGLLRALVTGNQFRCFRWDRRRFSDEKENCAEQALERLEAEWTAADSSPEGNPKKRRSWGRDYFQDVWSALNDDHRDEDESEEESEEDENNVGSDGGSGAKGDEGKKKSANAKRLRYFHEGIVLELLDCSGLASALNLGMFGEDGDDEGGQLGREQAGLLGTRTGFRPVPCRMDIP